MNSILQSILDFLLYSTIDFGHTAAIFRWSEVKTPHQKPSLAYNTHAPGTKIQSMCINAPSRIYHENIDREIHRRNFPKKSHIRNVEILPDRKHGVSTLFSENYVLAEINFDLRKPLFQTKIPLVCRNCGSQRVSRLVHRDVL